MGGKKNRPKTKWRKVSIGNESDKGEDQSAEEPEAEPLDRAPHSFQNGGGDPRIYEQSGEEHFLTNGIEEFEQLPIFHQTPTGLVHIPQNGFFPFPLVAPPPPLATLDGTPPPPLPGGGEHAPEGSVGGCYVNGLWIPNSELFKYGIHPPPNALSSTLVYHPNVPWVRLRPVPGPPPGGRHHHNHHHHHHPFNPEEDGGEPDQPLTPNGHVPAPPPPIPTPPPPPPMQLPMPNTIPPNSQYLLYFTRKPPPWYQTHPRDRDHNWRRRAHHHPSPYWSFNHASVHRNHPHQFAAQLQPADGCTWNGAASDDFGALSRHNESGLPSSQRDPQLQQQQDQTIAQLAPSVPATVQPGLNNGYEGTPYIYPGYSFGQPVFTAPVFPLSKSANGGSSRESPSTRSDEGESSSGVPPESSSSPASSSSRPSLSSVGGGSATTTEEATIKERKDASTEEVKQQHVIKTASSAGLESSSSSSSISSSATVKRKESVGTSEAAAAAATTVSNKKAADKQLTSSTTTVAVAVAKSVPSNLLPASPVTKTAASASSPESTQSQRSKKKKKRKKNKSSDMEKQSGQVNGLPTTESTAPVKPDSLDLKKKESPKAPTTVKLSNGSLPNFKIDLAGPSRESSIELDDSSPNRCPNAVILSTPFLEFAENLLRGTLEMARKEIAELHSRSSTVMTEKAAVTQVQSPAARQEERVDSGASQSLEDEPPTKDDVPPAPLEMRDAPASTLASTIGINTSPDEHGTEGQAGGTHSNLEKNLRGTFAEKLAERVISDSRTECRQTGHRSESLPLPVATPAFEGAVHPAADSPPPPPPPSHVEDGKKTTATVEDSPTADLRVVETSRVDWNGIDAAAADTLNSSSQLRLSSLNRPNSRSGPLILGNDSALVDSCSDGIGRSDQFLNHHHHHHNPTIVSRDERETGAFSLDAPDQINRNYSSASPPPSVDSSHTLLNSVAEYSTSSRNRALEEFADRVLYEIAVSIRDEFFKTKGDLSCSREEENEDSRTGEEEESPPPQRESQINHAQKWSPPPPEKEDVPADATRRVSREFDSLGSELGIRDANPSYQRRYSIGSYEGGEKYVDEATANYLAHLLPSDTLIRETEQELKSLQNRVLSTNHSIYKLAYDEVITDQSETDGDEASPFSSLTSAPEQQQQQQQRQQTSQPDEENYLKGEAYDNNPLSIKDFLPQRFEIMVHEADSMSEAGSEDVELIPRYDSGTTGDKHIYVNRLSLATELLRTQDDDLPYDDEFKPVTAEPTRTSFPTDAVHKQSESSTKKNSQTGKTNPGFVRDEMPLSVITSGPRASTMSTADSGVQSEEESGDEVAEEATEGQKDQNKGNLTSEEDQDQGQGQGQQGKNYRRMGAKTAGLGSMPGGGGPWDPCLCCCVM